jgi:hypothetical protein
MQQSDLLEWLQNTQPTFVVTVCCIPGKGSLVVGAPAVHIDGHGRQLVFDATVGDCGKHCRRLFVGGRFAGNGLAVCDGGVGHD